MKNTIIKYQYCWLFFLIIYWNKDTLGQRNTTPVLGAEIWLESTTTQSEMIKYLDLLTASNMQVARIFVWGGDFTKYDIFFKLAQERRVKIQLTFPISESPKNIEEAQQHENYLKYVVNHFKGMPALETWWLVNEPGHEPSTSIHSVEHFRGWLEKKYQRIENLNTAWGKNYKYFSEIEYSTDFTQNNKGSNAFAYYDWYRFSTDYLTQMLQKIAQTVKSIDDKHGVHVNPHALFSNYVLYDLPKWRTFLTSLGVSIHPSWHFTGLSSSQYTLGVAASAEIIRGASEPNPFWVSELQGGNNLWSGAKAVGPNATDIAQWTWASIGAGAERVIYWLLNNRKSGIESGEWSLSDLQGNSSDRLTMVASIAQTLINEQQLFAQLKPMDKYVTILIHRDTGYLLNRKNAKDELGRSANAHIFSAISYFQMITELGIPCAIKYIDDFDWTQTSSKVVIFPNMVVFPEIYKKMVEGYVAKGNKIIIDGLTGFFDENEQNITQNNFFLASLCGGIMKDIRTLDTIFKVDLDKTFSVPVHLWETELRLSTAKPIAYNETMQRILASRNSFGKGEVVWLPMLLGLGSWINRSSSFQAWLRKELSVCYKYQDISLKHPLENVTVQQLISKRNTIVAVVINRNSFSQKLEWLLPPKYKYRVVFSSYPARAKATNIGGDLAPHETLVLEFKKSN